MLPLVLLTLMIIAGIVSYLPLDQASASSIQQPTWVQPFHFRRSVLVQNPSDLQLSNTPVLLNLNFSEARVFSASNELRLFNASGSEVPSYLIDEQRTAGYVTSATILAFVSVLPKANISLWLYYGSLDSIPPAYRMGFLSSHAEHGLVSADLGTPDSQSYMRFTYARTYSQTAEPVVSYGSSGRIIYGSKLFGGGLLSLNGWHTIGNATQYGSTVASSTFVAGGLRVSEVVVVSADGLISLYEVKNVGEAAVSVPTLSLVLNDSELASLGPLTLSYSEVFGVNAVSVNNAYLNFVVSPTPTFHDTGSSAKIVTEVDPSIAPVVTAINGTTCALLQWTVNDLAPGAAFAVRSVMSVSSTLNSTENSILLSPKLIIGNESPFAGSYKPTVSGFWAGNLTLSRLTVSSGGAMIPLNVSNGILLPNSLSLRGTANFTLPRSFSSGDWMPSISSEGNSTAYASPSFWSVEQGKYLGRAAVFNYNDAGSSTAALTSDASLVAPSSDAYLVMNYRSSTSFTRGDPGHQQLYAALNVIDGLKGRIVDSQYFPVAGSSKSINYTGRCGASSPPVDGANVPPAPVIGGYLVGDGTWRTLRVRVPGLLASGNSRFQLVLCASASRGFVGSMELQATNAGVSFSAQAQKIMGSSLDASGSAISLTFVNGVFPQLLQLTANLSLSFEAVSTSVMNQGPNASFFASIPQPTVAASLGLSQGNSTRLSFEALGIVVYSSFIGPAPRMVIKGTSLSTVSVGNGVFLVPGTALHGAVLDAPGPGAVLQLRFEPITYGLRVNDAEGSPVAGATVSVTGDGSAGSVIAVTDQKGMVSYGLIPWNYTVTATLDGFTIFSNSINLNNTQSAAVSSTTFRISILTKDVIGRSIGTGSLTLSAGNFSKTFQVTNRPLSLQLPAGKQFGVSVEVGGSQVYSGFISAETNGSTIVLSTSYVPASIGLAAATAVVVALVIAGLLLYQQRLVRTRTRIPRG